MYNFRLDVPVKNLPDKALEVILFGTGDEKMEIEFTKMQGCGNDFVIFFSSHRLHGLSLIKSSVHICEISGK